MRLLLFLALAGCSTGLSNDDLAGADMATTPPNLSQPVWIGPGGSARSTTQQLNMQIGRGGTSVAPSGARLSSGYFSSQTN